MADRAKAEQNIRWVYHWLRWSAFITVPWMAFDLLLLELVVYQATDGSYALAVLLPALAHAVLLFGLGSPHLYARRHTQQALLLIGLRTLSALFFVGLTRGSGTCLWVIVSGFLWAWGSTWGLRQIERGDCWLMRWRGESAELPRLWAAPVDAVPPTETTLPAPEPEHRLAPTPKPTAHSPSEASAEPNAVFEEGLRLLLTDERTQAIDCLLAAFRTGPPDLRSRALAELEKLGEVETF